MTDELTAEMTGLWRVTTQGSVHLWDLDLGTYERRPFRAPVDASMLLFPNWEPVPWRQVERWPRVGESFLVSLPSLIGFDWHRSSEIRTIEEVERDPDERLP